MAQGASLAIDEALSAAFAGNPELLAVERALGIAEGERRQAGLLPNPSLSWEVEDTRADSRTTTLGITQPIELGGKRGARIDLAERGMDAATLELEIKRNALRGEVIGAFHAALRAQERVELAERSVELARRGLAVAEQRVGAGKLAPVEADRAQVQLAETSLELDRARMERASAYQRLALLMGSARPAFEQVSTEREPPPVPTPERLLARLEDSPELRLARVQVDQREAALGLAKTQRIPDLDVTLGSQYSHEDRERVNVVGLSMPIPLFDRNQGNILAEARRAEQARDLRNAAELRLRQETLQVLDQWRTAQREVEAFRQSILPSAQRAVERATRGFEMGKFGFIEVLDAQRTLIAMRVQYLQAQALVSDAWGRLESIYGDLSR
ncbi:TolC family protein [Zestomonas carbonaria]|uniref:Cobalt-zinc-cadmium resistance protein CzcC n=1 Tax=Zestomonas carbonaria TaxID=2762745 RepID=A0A7U7ERN6_9GAMM|nr:TolC family protein [Pseudomonas carbonaria]CAD5109477.1 Cobalt-zinc-cadmium resistance protein CzcC [Pseudomonas carbonaria]